ncbi:MAG: hemolysin family protein [Lentisphaeria bacterium]|jgi:CBS domain containing-hemolysin-like protein|nr:hemolysin family protein [Lentisphaeria bacterium]MDP7743068.1 hemolysin family protein [Lentisphaeria bacterium]
MDPGFWIIAITIVIGTWLTAVWAALSDLSRAGIRKLEQSKHEGLITRAEFWLDHRDDYRIAIRVLSFINLSLFALTCQSLLVKIGGVQASNAVFASLGFVVVLFLISETVGHWVAVYHWSILKFSVPLFGPFRIAAIPINTFQDRLARGRDTGDEEIRATTEDEIMSLVEQDATEEEEDGSLEDNERRMIRGIFDLDETLVKEIMTPRVDIDALSIISSIGEAKAHIVECGHSRIPVYRGTVDSIVGVVYSKHLLDDSRLAAADSVEQIMQQPVFVPETKNVGELLDEFRQRKNHLAVIIDEYGGTSGIVTIEDILEEIVGEIQDEFDADEPPGHQNVSDGAFEIDARMPIDEVNELLGVDISDDEEYDTIGGYVTKVLGRIPKSMENVQVPWLDVHILDADERKISRMRLTRNNLQTQNHIM